MLKYLKFFFVLLCAISIWKSGPVSSEAAETAPKSLINYVPSQENFPKELHQVVSSHQEQNHQKALKQVDTLLSSLARGFHDELYLLKGLSHEQLKENDLAQKAYQESLKLRWNNEIARFRLATMLKQTKGCKNALPHYKELLWQNKVYQHEVLYAISECLLDIGQDDQAVAMMEKAYQKNPAYLPVLEKVVATRQKLLNETADPQEQSIIRAQLFNDLQTITRTDKNNKEAALKLANMLTEQSDPLSNPQAIQQAEALASKFAKQSNFKDPEAVRALFNTQVKKQDFEAAEKTLKEGLERSPKAEVLLQASQQLDIERKLDTTN